MSNDETVATSNRRRFLELTGASVATGLAGCLGDSNGSGDGNGAGSDGGGQTTGTPRSTTELADSFEWWDTINVQSQAAREAIDQAGKQWSKENDVNVKVNFSGYGQLFGQKWIQAFQNLEYPHVYTTDMAFTGKLMPGGWIKPLHRWESNLTSGVSETTAWADSLVDMKYSGFGQSFEFPIGWKPHNPFIARMDHFEEAGLDPEEDFPPKSYDHLVEVATTLQNDGPGDFGFHIFGNNFDWQDILQTFATAEGGKEGLFVNENWSELLINNDHWKEWANKYADLYLKHGVSGPNTPAASDEDMIPLINNGKVSMTQPEILAHPAFVDRAPEKIKDGTIRWGPMWKGEAGFRGTIQMKGIGITRPPKGVDEDEWNLKSRTAIKFMNETILSKEFQANLPNTVGMMPIRDDVWEQTSVPAEEEHRLLESSFKMQEDIEHTWSNHPSGLTWRNNIPQNYIPPMLKGELEPGEALEKIVGEANRAL